MSSPGCDHSASLASCLRCGDYICENCRVWRSERAYCAPCSELVSAAPSRRARLALLLSTLGVLTLVPGVFAWVLGQRELGAVARGESSEASESFARIARALGIFEVVVLAAWLVRGFMAMRQEKGASGASKLAAGAGT